MDTAGWQHCFKINKFFNLFTNENFPQLQSGTCLSTDAWKVLLNSSIFLTDDQWLLNPSSSSYLVQNFNITNVAVFCFNTLHVLYRSNWSVFAKKLHSFYFNSVGWSFHLSTLSIFLQLMQDQIRVKITIYDFCTCTCMYV